MSRLIAFRPVHVMLFMCVVGGLMAWSGCTKAPQQPSSQPPIDAIALKPIKVEADTPYAHVFKPLDGHWKGTFAIYTDTRGQTGASSRRPTIEELDPKVWKAGEPYALQMTIDVDQRYTSESPYFQRVVIQDTYTDAEGNPKTVRSEGVNKVQEGKLWCVVVKPDETVIHTGESRGDGVLIWSRELLKPAIKVEYFYEEVQGDTYSITGWGIYAGDQPDQGPRMYFHGVYQRAP
ncbi:MAG: hypothetical protein AAFX99_08840 [Myxococcota bacterium]